MAEARWTINDPVFATDQVHERFAVSPWAGHRNFAYDLIAFTRPARIVELGTHWGTSFFAFCQAVRDLALDTHLVAIDTWVGDGHTGPYGEDVYETVRQIVAEHFAAQNIDLLRMTFAEARARVEDETVDILHIDGCHNYAAVSEDYHSWLPKLRADGVVLFHDVAPDTKYDSARFFEELRGQHPGLAFGHSWGLGVLFPKGDRLFEALEQQGFADKLKLYEYKAELQLAARKLADTTEMALSRARAIEEQSRMIDERTQHARGLERELATAEQLAADRECAMNEQSRMIAERDAWVQDLQRQLSTAEQLLDERMEALGDQSRMIAERDAWVNDLRKQLAAAERVTVERDNEIRRLTDAIHRLEARLAELDRKLAPLRRAYKVAVFPLRILGVASSRRAEPTNRAAPPDSPTGAPPTTDDQPGAKEAL